MQKNNANTLLLIASAVIALSAGVWFGLDNRQPVPVIEIQGVILPQARVIDEFTLIDNKKAPFTLQNLKNNWSLLFFGYTHCPDVCPTTLATLKRVQRLLQEQKVTPPQIVFVSIDPQRDTPEILDEYMAYFSDDFIGVTGELSELEKLTGSLGVYFRKAAGASGDINADDYAMDHTASFIVVNPEGKVAAFLTAPHDAKTVIRDLRTIVSREKQG